MTSAISIRNLNKTYRPKHGDEKIALKDVSLDIPAGSFFGLLGPNGAGKSTIINILAGLVKKTSGEVTVNGYDLDKDPRNVKFSMGVVPQELILDPFFTVREALEFHAGYYGVPKSKRKSDQIIKQLKLSDKVSDVSKRLSGGMRRRLLIGKALVHDPKVLILDEPTAGVDIELRRSLWEYCKELNRQGTTIVLTTHYLEEADELCDNIAIINHGKIVAHGRKDALLKNLENKVIVFKFAGKLEKIPESLAQYNPRIVDENALEVQYNPSQVNVGQILEALCKSGANITDLVSEDAKLEDLFLQMTKAA